MSQRVPRLVSAGLGFMVALFVAALLGLVGAQSASAIVIHTASGQTLSYVAARGAAPAVPTVTPFDSIFHNLDYNGGPVMTSNTNYTFYWAPAGSTPYPSDYQPGLNQYFEDIAANSGGHENVESVATQYNNAAGEVANYTSHFGGAIVDTNPYPTNGCSYAAICLTDTQIRTELTNYIKAHNLPSDLAHEYFVLTPPGVESCLEGTVCSAGSTRPAYCAYHGSVKVTGGLIIYANDPYVTGNYLCDTGNHPNGHSSDGALVGGLSHEHIESLTDPEPNNAWTDWASGPLGYGYEIGDKCRTFNETSEYGTPLGTAPNGARYNQVINGHYYWYQQEWSNQGHTCLQRFTFKGVAPKAAFTMTTNATNPELATFNGSASTAPGGVAYYEWQLNATSVGSTPLESSLSTMTYEFATTGKYDVALTVFAADGTSNGTAQMVNVAEPPEPTVTSVAPTTGATAGGTAVTITGTGFANVTAVKFGTAAAASYTVNSETSITATSPAGTGTVDVTVVNSSGTSEKNTGDEFTYVAGPTVSAVSPSSGPEAGGTSVGITGTGFSGATAVKFGTAAAASYTVNSATSITAVSPAGAGTVDVTVTTPGGTSATGVADRFSYALRPTVTKVGPAKGPVAGGTTVTITGTNFTGVAVYFGSTSAASITVYASKTKITAVSPAGVAGTVDVTVVSAGGTSAISAADHFKFGPPVVTSMSPNTGSKAGGTRVTVTGAGFEPGSSGTSFKVGKGQATAVSCASTTECTFSTPAAKVVGTVDVFVTVNTVASVKTLADHFTYN